MILRKKAELSSTTIVSLVLLVAGFVIIALIYTQFDWTSTIDREVCHESVVLRMSLPDTFDIKDLSPLKCKTRKVCITDKVFGKGDCFNEGGDYETIRVTKEVSKRDEQINMFVAREMADCWIMMGEGRAQIFTRDFGSESIKKRCSICTRIAFDPELENKLSLVGGKRVVRGLGEYLISHKVPNREISYWDFLTSTAYKGHQTSLNQDYFTTTQKAIVFMEADASTAIDWIYGGLMAGGGATIGGKLGLKAGIVIGSIGGLPGQIVGGALLGTLGVVAGGVGGAIIGVDSADQLTDEWVKNKIGTEGFASGNFFVDYIDTGDIGCRTFESIPS